MGQLVVPGAPPSIILSAVDRLVATNADGGISPLASHIILLGENAGRNLGDVDFVEVIGAFSLSGGMVNTLQEGTAIYGANIFNALINTTTQAQLEGPNVAIGFNIAPLATQQISANVLIGGEIANDAPANPSNLDASVVIGYQAIERQRTATINGGTYARRSVILGFRALRGSAFTNSGAGTSINESIFIGSEAGQSAGFDSPAPGTALESTVCIGTRAMQNVCTSAGAATSGAIAIGFETAQNAITSQGCIWIGGSITVPSLGAANDVIIGSAIVGSHADAGKQNIVIGARANIASPLSSRNIFIGSGANSDTALAAPVDDNLLVETIDSTSGLKRCLIYGNMGTVPVATVTACGLAFGLSGAANRDLPGMNIVKIIDGSSNGTNPVGGGFFFGVAGEIRWKATAGPERLITGTFTVATLPAAAGRAGSRAFVTDALAPAFGAAVAGAGAVFTTVFSNGAAWIVG